MGQSEYQPRADVDRGALARKRVLAVAIGLAIAIPLLLFGPTWFAAQQPEAVTLRDALASRLGCAPELLQLNLPPAQGRYPGALLVPGDAGIFLPVSMEFRSDASAGPTFEIQSVAISSASAALSGSLVGLALDAEADAWLDLSLSLRDARVFDMTLGELRSRIANDSDVPRLRKLGHKPLIITRALEAQWDLRMGRRSGASAEQWSEVRDTALDSGAKLAQDGSLIFTSQQPSVIAYHVSSASVLADSFAPEGATVELREYVKPDATAEGRTATHRDTALLAVSSSRYVHGELGDLPAARASVDLLDSTLEEVGQKHTFLLDDDRPLTAARLRTWLSSTIKRGQDLDARSLVFYWAGHSVSLANGQLYLVMGDYSGDLQEDIGEMERRDLLDQPGQPLAGSNIGDLLAVMQALEDEAPVGIPGLVPAVSVYKALQRSGRPFVMLIDGCYPAEGLRQLRDELYLTEWGDYYGPGDSPDASRYAQALELYGKRPYLNSENPVVLAARPGTLAALTVHPWSNWSLSPGVGPLAARIAWCTRRERAVSAHLSWEQLLRLITDSHRGLGQQEVTGSISWSHFAAFSEIRVF